MRDVVEGIRDRGADLYVIGNGSGDFARAFREDLRLDVPILIDPELQSYRAAGLRRGRVEILSPRMPLHALRALRAGYRQTSVQGDPWQLGGVFIVSPSGELLFRQASREAGDHADPAEILLALENATAVPEHGVDDPGIIQQTVGETLGALLDPTIVLSFDRTGFLARSLSFRASDLDVDLRDRRYLITGANSGIGYEASAALADLGAEVVLLCRNPARAEESASRIREVTGNPRVSTCVVDLSDLTAVRAAAEELSRGRVDGLIHNAGVLPDTEIHTQDGLELTFATHIAGPHLLTRCLVDRLRESPDARVLWVTSGGMYTTGLDIDAMLSPPSPYDGVRAYARTKRAQVVLAEMWAEKLAGAAVVNAMHPGWADTPAVRSSLPTFHRIMRPLLRTPAEGADTLVWLAASEPGRRQTGRLFFDRLPRRTHYLPTTHENPADRSRLWDLCEKLTENTAPEGAFEGAA